MLYNWYIRLEFVLCFLIGIFTIFPQSSIISFCFSLTFILLFLTYLYYLFEYKKVNVLLVLLIVLSFSNVMINTGYNSEEVLFSFDYSKKIIIFISTVLSFYITLYITPDKKTIHSIVKVPILLGCVLIVSYFFLDNTQTIAQGITLGFSNPNFTAMWLIHLLFYGVYFFFQTEKLPLKIGCILYTMLLIHLIILTRSRACMGGIICFVSLLILGLVKRSYKLSAISIFTILLFPLLFAIVYLQASDYLMYTTDFDFVVSEGKGIMSRFTEWSLGYSHFLSNWWTGDYVGISDGTGLSQMHNTHLDILVSYGIIPFVLFIAVLWTILKKTNNRISDFSSYIAFISFLTIILTGTFEAGLVSGCMGLNFLTSGFLLLAKGEKV